MGWKEGSAEKIMLHGIIGGIMADINGGKFGEGLTVGAINEILIGQLSKLTKKDEKGKDIPLLSSEQIRWISALVGGVVSETVGGNAGQGAGVADSATTNNNFNHAKAEEIYQNLTKDSTLFQVWLETNGEALSQQGINVNDCTPEQMDKLLDLCKSIHLNNLAKTTKDYNKVVYGEVKDIIQQGSFVLAGVASIAVASTDAANAPKKIATIYSVHSGVVTFTETVYILSLEDMPAGTKALHITAEFASYYVGSKLPVGKAYQKYWENNQELLKNLSMTNFDVAVGSLLLQNMGNGFMDSVTKAIHSKI